MNRPWLIWAILFGCAVLILGMFAWITQHALTSEKERVEAEAAALLGERMRLSLSRMDVLGTDLLVAENLRAPMFYKAVFKPSDIILDQYNNVSPSDILQASPLLSAENDFVQMHFEMTGSGKAGDLSSPQVPVGDHRVRASSLGVEEAHLLEMAGRMERLDGLVPSVDSLAALFTDRVDLSCVSNHEANLWIAANAANIAPAKPQVKGEYQDQLAQREGASRKNDYNTKVQKAVKKSEDWGDSIMSVSPFLSMWHGEELFFVREVRRLRSVSYQGLWIEREALELALMAEVPPDLAEAKLVRRDDRTENEASLVSLPWSLLSGPTPIAEIPVFTPLRKTLIASWVAALLSLLASGFCVLGDS